MTSRANESFENETDFKKRFVDGADLNAQGIVHILSGGLELEALNIQNACLIAAEGTITIRGRLVQTQRGSPLTLVSLNGDIDLQTEQKVDAHLVALNGTLRTKKTIHIIGGVAVHHLDLKQLTVGNRPKTIRYNTSLDPTDADQYQSLLQVYLSKKFDLEFASIAN